MTFTRMSTGNPYTICTLSECGEYEFGRYSASAWYPYHTNVFRILHPAYPCKISSTITAPVAKKTYDFRLFIFRHI